MVTSKQKIRYVSWDNIKGILIFLVVLGHFLLNIRDSFWLNNFIFNFIYMFHMGAFVFVSGYFSKSENSSSFNSLLNYIIAYVILQSGFIFWQFPNINSGSLFEPLYSAWYILALVIWRISTPYLSKIKYILPILYVASLFSIFNPNINMQFGIIKIIAFYPFFMLGFLFKKEHLDKIINISKVKKVIIALIAIFFAIIIGIFSFKVFNTGYMDLIPTIYKLSDTNMNNFYSRICIYLVGIFAIISMLFLSIEKKLPIITKMGENSFVIYLLHRPIVLAMSGSLLMYGGYSQFFIALFFSLTLCIITGSDRISHLLKSFINNCANAFSKDSTTESKTILLYRSFIIFLILMSLLVPLKYKHFTVYNKTHNDSSSQVSKDIKYRIMSDSLENKIQNSFKILFTGDLILLEDQVKRAYNGKNYDFSEYFRYTKEYIEKADLAIGVLEGPFGGNKIKYSQSNFGDGKKLYINFPDEFADSIKDAGFDIVTTANNHLLDTGLSGSLRTIDVLNEKRINYVGSYQNIEQKNQNRVKLIEKDGLKIAILAYTYGINNYTTEHLYNDTTLGYITNFIPNIESKLFTKAKKDIENDFKIAKKYKPDLIIVLPHWGTQFENNPDKNQLAWQKIFINYGADIILGCHTHSVQPVYIKNNKLTLFSPGNFANIYREHNGDASMMVEVYIDRNTKKVFSGAIIPMWTQSLIKGNYKALPIYDIFNNNLANQVSTHEQNYIESVLKHITKFALNNELDFKIILPKYYFDENGFIRTKSPKLKIDDTLKNKFYRLLTNSKNVCFIGDSITDGTKNGGIPWYEPIEYLVKGKVSNISWGGETSVMLLYKNHLRKIVSQDADTYVIAIGTNDIRYQNSEICAMTKTEYINNLQKLRDEIIKKNKNAKFVFISPWYSTDGDKISVPAYNQRLEINKLYSETLRAWCKKNNDIYVNPNKYIKSILDKYPNSDYLLDAIHPNGSSGVRLYSEAVLRYQ